MSDPEHLAQHASPGQLADLLECTQPEARLWRPEELGALLRHQLTAPIEVDLGSLPKATAQQLKGMTESEGLLLKSLADLLDHPRPPLSLLRLVKDFAKAAHAAPRGPLPPEIARVMYYSSIAAAYLRWGERITQLDGEAMLRGFDWVQNQDWVCTDVKGLVAAAQSRWSLDQRNPSREKPDGAQPPTPGTT